MRRFAFPRYWLVIAVLLDVGMLQLLPTAVFAQTTRPAPPPSRFEAEDADISNGAEKKTDIRASGGEFVQIPRTGSIHWQVTVPTDGRYELIIRYRTGPADRAEILSVNGLDLIRAALMAIAAVVIATNGPALVVYAVVILTNLVGVAFRPAQAALLPGLARDPAELSAANVAASTLDAVSTFAGTAIGGIILALWNVEAVFGVNALWFLSSAVLLVGLRAPAPAESPLDEAGNRPGFASELSEDVRAVASDRNVATVTGLYTAQAFIAGALNVLVVLVAFELIDGGETPASAS